jgi:hypothetical protein
MMRCLISNLLVVSPPSPNLLRCLALKRSLQTTEQEGVSTRLSLSCGGSPLSALLAKV